MHDRRVVRLLVAASLAALIVLSAGIPGAAASKPAGGAVRFWATPTSSGASSLVVARAIGDYGSAVYVDQNGKADPNGTFAQVNLKKGSFRINLTAYRTAANQATFRSDKTSCSSDGTITAPGAVSRGTGIYQGVSGRVTITLTPVWILARAAIGKCDGTKVLFQSQYLTGTGTVSFS